MYNFVIGLSADPLVEKSSCFKTVIIYSAHIITFYSLKTEHLQVDLKWI